MLGLGCGWLGLGCANSQEHELEPEPGLLGPTQWVSWMRREAGFERDPSQQLFPERIPSCCGSYTLVWTIGIDADGFLETDVFSSEARPSAKRIPKAGPVHDYPALERMAAQFKMLEAHGAVVEVVAEPEVPVGVIANTILAVAGMDCRMPFELEEVPEECLFWAPVVALPNEGMRLRLAAALIERGMAPHAAFWSSMDHWAWTTGRAGDGSRDRE